MSVTSTAITATCPAYLRVDLATGIADLICGAQVASVVQTHLSLPGDDVLMDEHGRITVRRHTGARIQYEPVFRVLNRAIVDFRHLYSLTTYRGVRSEDHGEMSAMQAAARLNHASGRLYRLVDGSIVVVAEGRLCARWTPVTR